MSEPMDDFAFCQTELKHLDPVRHFIALTAPEIHRPSLMVLFAFLATLNRIPAQVSTPEMGQIRLQWWRDIIADTQSGFGNGCGLANVGPLATALKQILKQYRLSVEHLTAIVDALGFNLEHNPIPDETAYRNHVWQTDSLPMLLASQILNKGEEPRLPEGLMESAGLASGLARHLQNWPLDATNRQLFLPLDSFTHHGVSLSDLFSGGLPEGLRIAIEELCQLARANHQSAMASLRQMPKEDSIRFSPAFLTLATVPRTLSLRSKTPTGQLSVANWRHYWSIWRMAARF
nr:squalene/phytoene synthase family protein [uncultured Cohaesibacter sp.]